MQDRMFQMYDDINNRIQSVLRDNLHEQRC